MLLETLLDLRIRETGISIDFLRLKHLIA